MHNNIIIKIISVINFIYICIYIDINASGIYNETNYIKEKSLFNRYKGRTTPKLEKIKLFNDNIAIS